MLLLVAAEGALPHGVAVELWVGGHIDLASLPGEVVVAV